MAAKKGIRKICSNGHVFYKSSDCPVCPVCEKERKPGEGFLSEISAPARRALESAGLVTLGKLANKKEKEVAGLHGIGPTGMLILKKALQQKWLKFKS